MCRNIKPLRRLGAALTADEVEAAARQYVRKVSGIRVPSSRTAAAFEAAVAEVAASTSVLLEALGARPLPAAAREPSAHPAGTTEAVPALEHRGALEGPAARGRSPGRPQRGR